MTEGDLATILKESDREVIDHYAKSILDLETELAALRAENETLRADRALLLADADHPSHVWCGILRQCSGCGEFRSSRLACVACDPSKLAGKVEFCCECAGEYPASDLIAGHIYCPTCRAGRQ